jgi:hypothetical protein
LRRIWRISRRPTNINYSPDLYRNQPPEEDSHAKGNGFYSSIHYAHDHLVRRVSVFLHYSEEDLHPLKRFDRNKSIPLKTGC